MADAKTAKKPAAQTAKKKPARKPGGYEHHPIAEIFPMLPGPEIKLLADSIKTVGLKDPIWLAEGKILDGRNRKLACEMANVKPRYENVPEGADLLEFMLACNAEKRNLSASQRAMVAAKLEGKKHGGDRKSGKQEPLPSLDEIAKRFRVSKTSVKEARTIRADCDKKIVEAIEAGKVKVSDAAKEIVRASPPAEQRKALKLLLAEDNNISTLAGALAKLRNDRRIEEMHSAASDKFAEKEAEKRRERLEKEGISEEEYQKNPDKLEAAWAKEDAEQARKAQRDYEDMDATEPIPPMAFLDEQGNPLLVDTIWEATSHLTHYESAHRPIHVAADPEQLLFFRDPDNHRKFLGKKK